MTRDQKTAFPERLDHFMARANGIYYATHDPFADFTTSPEISQVFGEVIGLWAAVAWQLLGSPDPLLLVEAGPGRGTLMADALRAIRQAAPAFFAALRVHLIETSPRLRAAQSARIPNARWHDDLTTVPDAPMILLANEFLDALPIRQYVRRGDGWTERFVEAGQWVELPADPRQVSHRRGTVENGVGEARSGAGGVGKAGIVKNGIVRGNIDEGAIVQGKVIETGLVEGDIVEVNDAARVFVANLTARLRHRPGAALFVDYGPARSAAGDSLQALADKRPVSPLSPPGSADLTAHVDFADLADIARAGGGGVQGPDPQRLFLTQLGLMQRTERLARNRTAEQASALHEAARRLVDPTAMGHLFKVMAVRSASCPPLPGLSPF